MKTKLLPFLLTAAIATPSFAQTLPASSEADASAAMEQFEVEVQNNNGDLKTLGTSVQKAIQSVGFSSKIEEELSKYRLKLTVDIFGNITNEDGVDTAAYYQYVVEPAFRNNEQMRKDIWVLNLKGTKNVVSAGTQVKVTFVRYFSGENAKRKAAFAPVKWFWEAPLNSNDIKTKLAVGEGYRFEASGEFSLGKIREEITSGNIKSVTAAYKRAGAMIMDLYKVSETSVRGRFIGIKNRGEIELSGSLKAPEVFSSAPGKINDLLSIGVGVKFKQSFLSLGNPLSLDTLMMDYLFNFSTTGKISKEELAKNKTTGEAALEEILRNMKHGKLASIFLFFTEDGDLMSALREKTKIAEEIAKEDLEKFNSGKTKFADLRVYNYFKGRMISRVRTGEINAKLSGLVGGSSQSGSISSHVAAYDHNETPHYFWLDNSFTLHKGRALFGRNKYNYSHDLDVLIKSDANRGVGALQDVVVRTQIEDTALSKEDMESYRTILKNSLPYKHGNSPEVNDVLVEGRKTNAYFSIRQSFGEGAFKVMGKMDRPRLAMKIYDYLKDHPHRAYMNLPTEGHGEAAGQIGLGTYAEQKAHDIANIFEPSATNEETMQAFQIAKRDALFERYLVSELFSKLLPQENPDPYFGYDLKFSSAQTGTRVAKGGNARVSGIYDAVAFMRSIITDQSMDMQMTSSQDYSGNTILSPASGHGVNMKNLIGSEK
ncbi:MAG: hypothetical protein HUU57_03230 [Bdellovibrio sp.]|nr:hypothetical protein [Bdellovibrio sp.]